MAGSGEIVLRMTKNMNGEGTIYITTAGDGSTYMRIIGMSAKSL